MTGVVNILGTEYTYDTACEDLLAMSGHDGVCRCFDKQIFLRPKELMGAESEEGLEYRFEHVLRHELVHAVAEECGVAYGDDEVLVDWIAHIIPIVNKAFNEVRYGNNKGSQSTI